MYNKVLILEIKEKYCIAMMDDGTIVRIVKKPNVKVGEAVYILDEDVYDKNSNVAYFGDVATMERTKDIGEKKKVSRRRNNMFKKLTAVAAAAVVFATALSMPKLVDKTYATVSVDGEKSVQLSVNKENEIVKAESFDGSFSSEELKALQGRNLFDLEDEFAVFDEGGNRVLISSASENGHDKDYDELFVAELRKMVSDVNGIYVQGKASDIKESIKQNKTLGILVIEKAIDDGVIEEIFEDMSPSELKMFISKYGYKLDDDYIEAIMSINDEDFEYYEDDNDDDTDNDADEPNNEDSDTADDDDSSEEDD